MWGSVEPSERPLHVYRWLVDAEANLRAARHINDKLRRQHEEEKMVSGGGGGGEWRWWC